MARIRHIAIATRDLEATTQFYIEGLGLKEVGKINTPTSEGYYLSDGHVNFAILKFKYDEPAKTEGTLRYTGIHHFGLEVEDMEEARARIEKAGAVHRPYPGTEEMAKRGNVEVKFSGPGRCNHRSVRARLGWHQVNGLCDRLPVVGFKFFEAE